MAKVIRAHLLLIALYLHATGAGMLSNLTQTEKETSRSVQPAGFYAGTFYGITSSLPVRRDIARELNTRREPDTPVFRNHRVQLCRHWDMW